MSDTETLNELADNAADLCSQAVVRLLDLIAKHPESTLNLRLDARLVIAPIVERLENIQSEAGSVIGRMA